MEGLHGIRGDPENDAVWASLIKPGSCSIHTDYLETLAPEDIPTPAQVLGAVRKLTGNPAIHFNDLIAAGVCVVLSVAGVDAPSENATATSLRLRILGCAGEVSVPMLCTDNPPALRTWQKNIVELFSFAENHFPHQEWHVIARRSLEADEREVVPFMKRMVSVPHDLVHPPPCQSYSTRSSPTTSPVVSLTCLRRFLELLIGTEFPEIPAWVMTLFPGDPGIVPAKPADVTLRNLLAWELIFVGNVVCVPDRKGAAAKWRKPVGNVMADGSISCCDGFATGPGKKAPLDYRSHVGDPNTVHKGAWQRVMIASNLGVFSVKTFAECLVENRFGETLPIPEKTLDQVTAELSEETAEENIAEGSHDLDGDDTEITENDDDQPSDGRASKKARTNRIFLSQAAAAAVTQAPAAVEEHPAREELLRRLDIALADTAVLRVKYDEMVQRATADSERIAELRRQVQEKEEQNERLEFRVDLLQDALSKL